ncbi:MAG: DUF115 domain-containing protein [Treponema sp.]|jgi:hypothetical protein|nr:DUF115 domain-containing protein [Treponema sp.]
MSIWEKNRRILQQHYPGFLEEITLKDNDDFTHDDIKIEITPAGQPTLCVKGISVHSQRDPLREGQRLADSVCTENGAIVILGFGLGYAALAAAALGRPIIVVEKHKNLLLKAFELLDFSDFLSKNRVMFVIGGSGEGITNALAIADNLCGKKKSSVIRNKALAGLDEQWYKLAEKRIHTWTMKDEINDATRKRFEKRWTRNLSRNLSSFRDLPGVSHLTGLASGDNPLPVFLAAAGPSLDKTKPLLRDIHERCIVVAVDTSLRFFVQNGISPDFAVVVDPQFINSRHLDRCVNESTGLQTVLVAEPAVYPSVLNLPFKNKFLCGSMLPLGSFMEKEVDIKGTLGAGGSVATTAWDFSRLLGSRQIWIAGLDLAFPGFKTHFRGARFETLANSLSGRFNPVEKWVVRALRDGVPFRTPSGAGGLVLTDKRLSLYASWFENQFRQHTLVQNLSFFRDGMAISGLEAADIEKFLALPKRREEIDCRIKAVLTKTENDFNEPEKKQKRAEQYEKAILMA